MSFPRIIAVALAAFALAGAIEAAPAQAKPTVICSVNQDPCPESSIDLHGLYGYAWSKSSVPTHMELVTTLGTVECDGTKLVFEQAEKQGEPLQGQAHMVFSECTYGGNKCEVASPTYRSATVEAVGLGNGVLTVSEPWVEPKCLGSGNCKYGSASMQASVTGGKVAILEAEVAMPKLSGSLCPSEVIYDGEFEDMNSPAYITHA